MRDRTNYAALIRQLRQRNVRLQWWRDDAMRRARAATEPRDRTMFVQEARIHNRAIVWRQRKILQYLPFTRGYQLRVRTNPQLGLL